MDRVNRDVSRRQFIVRAGSAAGTVGILCAAATGVSIAIDPNEATITHPVLWAADELQASLEHRSVTVSRVKSVAQAQAGQLTVLVTGANSAAGASFLKRSGVSVSSALEALALVQGAVGKTQVILACGQDERGLVYSLLELSDRVQNSTDPLSALAIDTPIIERPANTVRSVTRLFTSDVEDKPWYNDRDMWPQYLTMLASQRFNRFNLAFGMGYDFLRQVTDAYFLFAYPFLISVPGYNVRASPLPDQERDRNLAMLQFISEQTVSRGMEFQLGLWMHGYEWIDSPHPNYTIEGLSREQHGPYCRDAVRQLLQQCPAISGITFRVHGESGVQEGSYDFWKTVFDGVATCGRPVRIDMHAKGMDQSMLDMAVATGCELTLSPKFWAEHMGMTYHQTDIRELERPKPEKKTSALMNLSEGSRSFMRYGYGDLLRENRRWKVVHRIWPGTQRLLLWGDPLTASAYSKEFSFCGSAGVEICEPLSFKGRRGSGIAGDRCAYADVSLKPPWDWQKYVYGYRIWGRMLYNPETAPEVWRRYLRNEFADGAEPIESALANASRILPIVTTGHAASAANNNYWPEIYLNQSLIDADHYQPYTDTPAPRVFGNVSPLDPQLFSRMNDYADELLENRTDGKYSPIEVAQWVEDCAEIANKSLAEAESRASGKQRPEYRRLAVDVAIEAGLGRFFGAKFRAGVLYRLFEQTGDPTAMVECLNQYRKARSAWAELANCGKGVYMSDITVGEYPQLRGHWLDRLPVIDRDIAALEPKAASSHREPSRSAAKEIRIALSRPAPRSPARVSHIPALSFQPGQALTIDLAQENPLLSAKLYYRHVDQAERFNAVEMERSGHIYRAIIAAEYTNSDYPLQYYFELKEPSETSLLYPGLSTALTRQPYFVVRRSKSIHVA